MMPALSPTLAVRVCSGTLAAVMGLRWILRGGRSNGLIAIIASVLYMVNRKAHDRSDHRAGGVVKLGAPGDRNRDPDDSAEDNHHDRVGRRE